MSDIMEQDFGIVFNMGYTPMMGVAKKVIEAIGYPDKFCICVNCELKRIAIARDYNSRVGVSYAETEETNDYYWLKGGTICHIAKMLRLPNGRGTFYLQGKYISADQAVICDGLQCVMADLPIGNIPNTIMEKMFSTELLGMMADRESEHKSGAMSEDVVFRQSISSVIENKNIAEDKDFGWMIESALRYSLGRDGYAPEKTADFIHRYINQFDETTLFVMKRDIDAALQSGDLPCDIIWRAVSDDLSVRLESVKQARHG